MNVNSDVSCSVVDNILGRFYCSIKVKMAEEFQRIAPHISRKSSVSTAAKVAVVFGQ